MLENNVPNLDCMPARELMNLWNQWRFRRFTVARQLFPSRPKGYVGAMQSLACYCANKATAIGCREAGNIQSALVYEDICDKVYSHHLPDYAKW